MLPIEETLLNKEEIALDPALREMIDAGIFYGRKKSKTHPRMRPYILGTRNEIEIIDLAKTQETLNAACSFLIEQVARGGIVLFVATQPAAVSAITLARELGFPAVGERWLGGTLTNFKVISKRIEYFKKLKSDWASKKFEQYTKKERLELSREIERLTEFFGDLESLERIPEMLFVIDPQIHTTTIREAKRLSIPVIAFANTDSDPELLEYPIVGNTKARTSIEWVMRHAEEALREGIAKRAVVEKEKLQAKTEHDIIEKTDESNLAS